MKIDFTEPIVAPVLFMVFNRPEKTALVFDAIRSVRPKKLYVAVDHPRTGRMDDEENWAKVKAIVENVDWDCESHYLYHPVNRGCTLAGKLAWDWFFEQEDEMIFLEDDGLPNKSFFYFTQAMLEKYRYDERVAYIGGVNYGPQHGDATYFFSHMPAATYAMGWWKRTYKKYEYGLESFREAIKNENPRTWFPDWLTYRTYMPQFWRYVKHGGNTYDIQMIYLQYRLGMMSIAPNVNMASNIGMDGGANVKVDVKGDFYRRFANRPRYELEEIFDPDAVQVDETFERKWFNERDLHGSSRLKEILKFLAKDFLGCFIKKYSIEGE